MTQTFDLKNMGFAEMQNEELEVVDGGLGLPWVWLAQQIISNWDDIKSGFSAGYNANI